MTVLNLRRNRDHTASLAFLDPLGGVGMQRYDTLKYRQFDKLTDRTETRSLSLPKGPNPAHQICPQVVMPGVVYTRDVSCFFALFASSR